MLLKLYFIFLTVTAAVCEDGPKVVLKDGVILGTWNLSFGGRTYASFKGIPYAKPPVNDLRFTAPQRVVPWNGVWDSTVFGSPCIQYNPIVPGIIGDENCLFVNVYSPNINSNGSLPVVIFIHGGAFMYGTGAIYDPLHFMDRDLLFVTFNYRLGPLGFLSTDDGLIPGNFGLKDQALALRWIKENIKSFGGNPESITLTGNSAGGSSVHYHYLSPLSKGTFVRGISFSGSAFVPWAYATRPADKARKLALLAGCPTNDEMASCLKQKQATVLVDAQIKMLEWKVHLFTPFVPTVEPMGPESFSNPDPYHATLGGFMDNLPLMVTLTSEEGLYPAAAYQKDNLLPELEAKWEELASNIFVYNDTLPVSERAIVAQKIKQEYLHNQPVDNTTFNQLVQALGDRLFAADIGRLAQLHAASGQPVYMYRYSYRAEHSLSNIIANNNEDYGVSHADDIQLLLNPDSLQKRRPKDLQMKDMLLNMIYSYANTGIPSFGSAEWVPVKPDSPELNYLEITSPDQSVMKSSSDFGRRSFWNSLEFQENDLLYSSLYSNN